MGSTINDYYCVGYIPKMSTELMNNDPIKEKVREHCNITIGSDINYDLLAGMPLYYSPTTGSVFVIENDLTCFDDGKVRYIDKRKEKGTSVDVKVLNNIPDVTIGERNITVSNNNNKSLLALFMRLYLPNNDDKVDFQAAKKENGIYVSDTDKKRAVIDLKDIKVYKFKQEDIDKKCGNLRSDVPNNYRAVAYSTKFSQDEKNSNAFKDDSKDLQEYGKLVNHLKEDKYSAIVHDKLETIKASSYRFTGIFISKIKKDLKTGENVIIYQPLFQLQEQSARQGCLYSEQNNLDEIEGKNCFVLDFDISSKSDLDRLLAASWDDKGRLFQSISPKSVNFSLDVEKEKGDNGVKYKSSPFNNLGYNTISLMKFDENKQAVFQAMKSDKVKGFSDNLMVCSMKEEDKADLIMRHKEKFPYFKDNLKGNNIKILGKVEKENLKGYLLCFDELLNRYFLLKADNYEAFLKHYISVKNAAGMEFLPRMTLNNSQRCPDFVDIKARFEMDVKLTVRDITDLSKSTNYIVRGCDSLQVYDLSPKSKKVLDATFSDRTSSENILKVVKKIDGEDISKKSIMDILSLCKEDKFSDLKESYAEDVLFKDTNMLGVYKSTVNSSNCILNMMLRKKYNLDESVKQIKIESPHSILLNDAYKNLLSDEVSYYKTGDTFILKLKDKVSKETKYTTNSLGGQYVGSIELPIFNNDFTSYKEKFYVVFKNEIKVDGIGKKDRKILLIPCSYFKPFVDGNDPLAPPVTHTLKDIVQAAPWLNSNNSKYDCLSNISGMIDNSKSDKNVIGILDELFRGALLKGTQQELYDVMIVRPKTIDKQYARRLEIKENTLPPKMVRSHSIMTVKYEEMFLDDKRVPKAVFTKLQEEDAFKQNKGEMDRQFWDPEPHFKSENLKGHMEPVVANGYMYLSIQKLAAPVIVGEDEFEYGIIVFNKKIIK